MDGNGARACEVKGEGVNLVLVEEEQGGFDRKARRTSQSWATSANFHGAGRTGQ